MSWETQGRQEHGWFGSGSDPSAGGGAPADAAALAHRIDAVAHTVVAHLPRRERGHVAVTFGGNALGQLRNALPLGPVRHGWIGRPSGIAIWTRAQAMARSICYAMPRMASHIPARMTIWLPPVGLWQRRCSKSGWTGGGVSSPMRSIGWRSDAMVRDLGLTRLPNLIQRV